MRGFVNPRAVSNGQESETYRILYLLMLSPILAVSVIFSITWVPQCSSCGGVWIWMEGWCISDDSIPFAGLFKILFRILFDLSTRRLTSIKNVPYCDLLFVITPHHHSSLSSPIIHHHAL